MNLRQEWRALQRGVRTLDLQTVCVLLLCAALVAIQFKVGSRHFFFAEVLPIQVTVHRELLSWGWWFVVQGVAGFVLPVLVLRLAFKQSWSAMGLGLGDWRLAGVLALLYLPIVTIGTWVLSNGAAFQAQYPHLRAAAFDWQLFAVYHALFLCYWIGWEYLWRGFVLFGTRHTFGLYAILIQAVPFALLHLQKPVAELALSLVGAVALGALVWRCRAFWIAVPIHALQMLVLDLWCALRLRTSAEGIGLDALWLALTGWQS